MPLYASKLLRWQHLCYVQFTTLKKAELLLVTPSATILFQATVISCWDYCKSLLTDLPASFQLELALSTQNNNKCSGLHKINVYFFLWWKSARRSNQAILKEISPEYSLEGLLLKPKFQYFDHQMQRANSLEKTLILRKIEGRRRKGWKRMKWLDSITDSMDMNLSKLLEIVEDREAWCAAVHWAAVNPTQLSNVNNKGENKPRVWQSRARMRAPGYHREPSSHLSALHPHTRLTYLNYFTVLNN